MLRLAVGLAFIVVPVLELALLIKTGQVIGVWATVALVLTTALTGALIISRQSLSVLRRTLEAVAEGQPPIAPVLDGLFLLVAGALLLTPGLMTDVAALLLLIPPVRRAIARVSMRWLLRGARLHVEVRGAAADPAPEAQRRPSSGIGDGPVIEGEFERVDEDPPRPRRDGRRTPPP
jgi:UPF0716 protein FxsA